VILVLHHHCSSYCIALFYSLRFNMTVLVSKQSKENNGWVQLFLFKSLEADGSNYFEWNIDIRLYLFAKELENTMESSSPKGPPTTSK